MNDATALPTLRRNIARTMTTALLALLAACGGGGDAGTSSAAADPPPPSIATILVSLANAGLAVGQTRTLGAEAKDQNGAVVSGVSFSWSSSNSSVASVVDGVVTAASPGSAEITASSAGVTSNTVTLKVIAVAAGSVAIDKASVFFTGAGQTAQLLAAASGSSGSTIAWTSTRPDKVSVDANGGLQALAIGSAQIVAEAGGVKSPPTLVVVAQPQAGAVLVSDAQVLSVSQPVVADPEALVLVGAQYDVTLRDVAVPLPGTIVLAAESAPIAGRVVSTRQEGGNLVVTLAVVSLPDLFTAYDLDWTIDLSAFATEAPPTAAARATGLPVWNAAKRGRLQVQASARPLDALAGFSPFECSVSVKPQVVGTKFAMSLDNHTQLVIQDRNGYSKHAIQGSATLNGSASVVLKAGFKASGRCDVSAQIKLPVFGWLSVIVMPAVRIGFGAELAGEVQVIQGEIGVDGKVGFDADVGWVCDGVPVSCGPLETLNTIKGLKTKSSLPISTAPKDTKVKVSGHFYALAGFDLSLLAGLANAHVVDARIGPKQSFDLNVESFQASRPDIASNYDLKLVSIIEPGAALKEALNAVIGKAATGALKFAPVAPIDLSESPKGALTLSAARTVVGKPVDFTVTLNAQTVSYDVIGYNVAGLSLWRKRSDESDFTFWKFMELNASNQAVYRWTPARDEIGLYKVAAFVDTMIGPLPSLEVAPESTQDLEVSCYGGALATAARVKSLATAKGGTVKPMADACVDTWSGTSTYSDSAYVTRTSITWVPDPKHPPTADHFTYIGEGSIDIAIPGCSASPTHFTFDKSDPQNTSSLIIIYGGVPNAFGAGGSLARQTEVTCPGVRGSTYTYTLTAYFPMGGGNGRVSDDGLTIDASESTPVYTSTAHYTRP